MKIELNERDVSYILSALTEQEGREREEADNYAEGSFRQQQSISYADAYALVYKKIMQQMKTDEEGKDE